MKSLRTLTLLTFAALPCAAYAAGAPSLPGTSHSNRAPIEVTSDTLEVFQEENRAAFTGHVVVIQGDVRLKADSMMVYYRKPEDSGKKPGAKKKAATAGPGDPNAIRKIDAQGSVFLSTPEETASGASGTYDVEHHEIHLDDHVVLTRGKNVLKGSALTYNFNTGRSILKGEAPAANGKKERVRALFVPEKKDE